MDIRTIAVILLSGALTSASLADSRKAKEFNEQGMAECKKFRYEKAEDLFRKALTEEPAYYPACNNLGITLHKIGKTQEAIELFTKASALAPERPAPLNNLACVYVDLKDFNQAEAALKKAYELDPKNVDVHYNLWIVYKATGRDELAQQELDKALLIAPEQAGPHVKMATVLRDQGRIDEAATEARLAITIDSTAIEAHHEMGMIYQEQHRYDLALREFSLEIVLDATLSQPHYQQLLIYRELKDYPNALNEIDWLLRMAEDVSYAKKDEIYAVLQDAGMDKGLFPLAHKLKSRLISLERLRSGGDISQVGQFRGDERHSGYCPGEIPFQMIRAWAFASSKPAVYRPLYHSGAVIFNDNSGRIVKRSLTGGGQKLWELTLNDTLPADGAFAGDGSVYTGDFDEGSTIEPDIDQLYYLTVKGHLVCIDPAGGKIAWQTRLAGRFFLRPVLWRYHCIAISEEGWLYLQMIGGGRTGKLTKIKLDCPPAAQCVVAGNRLYLANTAGELLAIDLERLKIVSRLQLDGAVSCGLMLYRGRIYAGTDRGWLYCLRTEPQLGTAWSRKFPDQLESWPAAGDGRLWVGCNNGWLYAVRIKDGTVDRSKYLGGPIRSALALYGDRCLVNVNGQSLACVSTDELTDSMPVTCWQRRMDDGISSEVILVPGFGGQPMVLFGNGSGLINVLEVETGKTLIRMRGGNGLPVTPVGANNIAYWGDVDGNIRSLDIKNGEQLWCLNLGAMILQPVTVIANQLFVATSDDRILCLEARTGDILWSAVGFGTPSTGLLVAGNSLFFGTASGNLCCLSLATGQLVWSHHAGTPVTGTPLLFENCLIVPDSSGRIHCLNPVDGRPIWSVPVGAGVSHTPAVSPDGRLVVGDDQGEIHCLSARTGARLWSATLGGKATCSPAVDSTMVLVGDASRTLVALSLETGEVLWKRQLGGTIESSPAITANSVIVASMDRKIQCLGKNDSRLYQTYEMQGAMEGAVEIIGGKNVLIACHDGNVYCFK